MANRFDVMIERGYMRCARLTAESKSDTTNYGVLPLLSRSIVCDCEDSSYEESDFEYEVDIYLYHGNYVAVDAFDRL